MSLYNHFLRATKCLALLNKTQDTAKTDIHWPETACVTLIAGVNQNLDARIEVQNITRKQFTSVPFRNVYIDNRI